ncbi:MAG: dihydrofolate reductase [Nanoarchaeota archaeon]|nr:dihydrofolate reductase [Nanoarchaeota archaeon]
MNQPVIAVAAMTEHGHIIGKNNWLPWDIPDELQHFRKITLDGTVIMGRKTWDSIGRPMPKRQNIVVSSSLGQTHGIEVCRSLEGAIAAAKKIGKPIYVIGGRTIYQEALQKKLLDKLYLSFIKKDYPGDTRFPEWNEDEWKLEKEEEHPEWTFNVFSRIS